MVHERRLTDGNDAMEMRVSGKVLHGNLVMFDKKTGSEWVQETGKAISGPQEGQCLTPLDDKKCTRNVRWDVWKKQHPNSHVLFCDHCETENDSK